MLREFLSANRQEILATARQRVAKRGEPASTEAQLAEGLPVFLDQLGEALRKASVNEPMDHSEIDGAAGAHGFEQFRQGLSVAQVVHGYGDLCQVITGLAVDQNAPVRADEFQTLNLCLDDAIAGAVSAHAHHRELAIENGGTERLGMLAHEMRNELNGAVLSFATIRRGIVAPGGSTGASLDRHLRRLSTLINRSFADVRLDAGIQRLERVPVREVLDEVEMGAAALAETRGLRFLVSVVDQTVMVDADRQILAAAVSNLVQNAMKFTRPSTTVRLRARTTETRVLIDVEDECGGLPAGSTESLSKPFTQRGSDRSGLGLGLTICVKAMRALDGEMRVEDLPGKGCIFTLDLPLQPPLPTSIHSRERDATGEAPAARKASRAS
jgi:signal transduction histidine kinase